MENKGLLFIPDISGFTRFINETEVDHSRQIIQELLEILIDANDMGLEVSEIEGDAILFYKFGNPPLLKEVYQQVEKMFCLFHRSIDAYNRLRYCQCKACVSVANLTLKVITHYGEFTGYNVKNFSKLIGKDIIVAHQLLKNDIKHHEYWLITKSLLQHAPLINLAEWMQWCSSSKQIEAGEIPFHYTSLSALKNELPPESFPDLTLSKKEKMISLSKEYETDIITLFHASGDFSYRSRWYEGLKKVEVLNHFLPRVGMQCRCIFENGESITYSSSYHYQPDRIEFSETDEHKKTSTYYTLEKTGDNKTKLTLDFYIEKTIASSILFKLMKEKKMEAILRKSLQNLVGFVKDLRIPKSMDT
jgi:hypothetical protein